VATPIRRHPTITDGLHRTVSQLTLADGFFVRVRQQDEIPAQIAEAETAGVNRFQDYCLSNVTYIKHGAGISELK